MEVAKLVLQYIQAILTWPVTALILGLIFTYLFRKPISDFIDRITEGEGYGVRVKAKGSTGQSIEVKDGPQPPAPQGKLLEFIKENPEAILENYMRTYNSYWFERAYNLIYGSQIDLLEHLYSKADQGEKYTNLTIFYDRFINQSKLITTQMADYLNFLQKARFVEYIGEENNLAIKITPYGINFINYIKGQYPVSYKNKLF